MTQAIQNEFPQKVQLLRDKCKGLRASVSLRNLPTDVLKSALQKYARRGEFDKGSI